MVIDVNRREFLELSVAAGLAAIAAADQLRITAEDKHTVLTIAMTLFPHSRMSDDPYRRAVEFVARRCERRASVYSAVKLAVQRLEWASGWQYSTLPEAQRIRLLEEMRGSETYRILYCELLEGLYRTPGSWQLLVGG